ncbi:MULTISPECIES: TolC family protein [unclassified Capnocytophaga]|jgi:outer membrane efflux protein|uniref:TolC family protein n=1 Tax=unclassified Capnocytophaga TaxID=2640652 RepID=UPI0002A40655|nr:MULTISPECIES: TolC family protein [unclassified Capnocytophaga]EKY04622.1 outer membrane efflux protein [Capnocytophaga sp. oral taxon 380 str. F0488]QLF49388.1 TolC family protein [Capnocytophaga sp. oral taxon 902]
MKKIITSALLFLSFMSFAQQKELTLKDAIRYALENKADAEKARLEVTKSEYKIQEVRANALPSISASGGMVYNPKLQATYIDASTFAFPGMSASNEPIKMEMGQKWSANAEAKLTQVLFNQTVFMGLKAARTTREFYMLNQQLTENEIIEKVAQAYYQVYQTRQTLENIESNLALTEKTANVVKGLNQSGLSKKIDVDRTTVAVNNLKSARQQALNGVQLSENALKYMIGMPMSEVITLPKEGFEANYDLAFEKGNSNTRIELQVLEKQKQLLDLNTKVQRAALYPSLALQATYGYLSMGPKTPIIYGKKDKVYGADYSAITLGVNIPIFSGFGTRAKIHQAQIESQALEATLKDTRLAMDLAYENAHSQLTNNLLTIDSQKENVKLAEEVLLNTQNNYQQGLASLTDLLEAERSLSDAKNNYTNALLDYKLAEIQLLKSQGKLETMK